MIQITGKQVKALIDLEACEILITKSWVKYLRLKKMINKDIKVPNNLKGVNGEFLGIKEVILLRMNISRKKVKWRVWVANKIIIPLIIGHNFYNGRLVIDYPKLT